MKDFELHTLPYKRDSCEGKYLERMSEGDVASATTYARDLPETNRVQYFIVYSNNKNKYVVIVNSRYDQPLDPVINKVINMIEKACPPKPKSNSPKPKSNTTGGRRYRKASKSRKAHKSRKASKSRKAHRRH